jgi:pSer/pThr/pTyr-binding forkhead associated (FHA) protein
MSRVPSKSSRSSDRPRLNQEPLKLVAPSSSSSSPRDEYSLSDSLITIGRLKTSTIHLTDPLVSGQHAEIQNGFLVDKGSTNGTFMNGKPVKKGDKKLLLKAGDIIKVGDIELKVERGAVQKGQQELNRSKRFIGSEEEQAKEKEKEKDKESENKSSDSGLSDLDSRLSVEEVMENEFKRIIGHEKIKIQLRQFYKKVQLDRIRQQNGKETDTKRLYHMIFSGPPGTGNEQALDHSLLFIF